MEWLKEIFDKILSLLPTVFIIAPFEAGVRITFGKYYSAKGAGWYIIWPLIQRFIWMEIQTQVVDLRTQSIRTIDNADLIVSGAIQYSVKDIQKAIFNVQDIDKAVETLALGVIVDFIKNKTSEDCQDIEALKTEILRGIKDAAKGWGLKIERVYITDLGKTRNIRLLGNTNECRSED